MPTSNPDSELNIRRIDSTRKQPGGTGTHGFQVHFSRGGINFTRLFSDSQCGGKENARALAQDFRETLKTTIPTTLSGPSRTGPARSNTGHMGISISYSEPEDTSSQLLVQANVRIAKGKPLNKKFYLKDHRDLEDAIHRAIAWRNEILEGRLAIESAA